MVVHGECKNPSHDRGTRLAFGEIVGQDELKTALLAVATNDGLDGLLVQGEKGTAKSTAVRALTDLLPTQTVVEGCPYGCPPDRPGLQCPDCQERSDLSTVERSVPLVTLPLGATRERVVGTLSVADALSGEFAFDPGLLARANRGILYVDEVNLLDDHLVDILLDAAADGINRVERDGVSITHPADFTIVGTMNPEEGELRPQLRDRFALQATVTGCRDIEKRVEIIERATDRSEPDDPDRPAEKSTVAYRRQLLEARNRLGDVVLAEEFVREIAKLCREAGVDGHRGDIATARAAVTFAALGGRQKVIEGDIRKAAAFALPHRLQSRPFDDAPDAEELLDEQFDKQGADTEGQQGEETPEQRGASAENDTAESPGDESEQQTPDTERPERTEPTGGEGDKSETGRDEDNSEGSPATASSSQSPENSPTDAGRNPGGSPGDGSESGRDQTGAHPVEQAEDTPLLPGQSRADVGSGTAPDIEPPEIRTGQTGGEGDHETTEQVADGDGPRVRTRRTDSDQQIDAAASVRAAAARGEATVRSRDLRQSVHRSDAAALVVFVVDASASMRPAMRAAKGTVLELLKDAYQQRDEVAFVAFAGDDAEVLLPPTDSVTLAARHLKELPTGDRTPLPAGLRTATDLLDRADPASATVVLVTDGRANVAAESPLDETRTAARRLAKRDVHTVIVDAGSDDETGVVEPILDETDGERVPLAALSAGRIDAAVGRRES